MKHLCTTLATVLAAAFAASAKTFDWPIGSPAAKAETFTAYHGETVRFNLRLSGPMTNLAPVAIYYQTNGMGRAEWFTVPGTVFAPSNDCGAATYRFFVRCLDPDGVDYSANGTLRMLDSPGFEPSVVSPPVKTLDFSTVTVLNAPWIEEESDPTVPAWAKAENPPTPPDPDFSTNNQQLVDTIVATSPAPADYANVSNRAMSALQSYTETDPTVPNWAKSDAKPSYSASDVGALPNDATLAGIANFSNAVLQVGLNIDTNAVAAINALVEAGDELPIGGAATVGGLLLALAAAGAALKRGKVDKVDGKGLSTNDYTDEDKAKLAGVDAEIAASEHYKLQVDPETGAIFYTTPEDDLNANEGE